MQVKLHKLQLADALQTLAKAVERRTSLYYLQNVKLMISGEYLILQATNLERFLIIKVPVEESYFDSQKAYGEFSLCVNANKFAKLIKELDNEIILELNDTHLLVKSGKTKAKLLIQSDEEFPEFPEPVYDVEFEAKLLLDAIEKVSFAVSDNYDNLKCVLIDGKENYINFVGSDGYRLAIYKHPTSFDKRFNLHVSGLVVLKDLLDEADTVKLGATENMTFVATDLWELALRNTEGEYPDYEAVIPSDYTCKVVFDADEMDKALKKLLVLGRDAIGVEMFVGGEEIVMKTQSPDYGEIEVNVPVEEMYGEMHIAFNGKYLKQFIDNAEDTVVMKLIDAESPMVFENNENYMYVLMPMRL
jgi:DNA polymerase-3 subunit beta